MENCYIDAACGNDGGIWIAETERSDKGFEEHLRQISYSGEILQTIPLSDIAQFDSPVYTLRCTPELVFLKSSEKIVAADSAGRAVAEISLKDSDSSLVVGADGNAYLVCTPALKSQGWTEAR